MKTFYLKYVKPFLRIDKSPFVFLFCWGYIELVNLLFFLFTDRNRPFVRYSYFRKPFLVLVILFIYSFLSSYILDYQLFKLFQQFFVISIVMYIYSRFFDKYEGNTELLFINYIKASVLISVLGLLQVIVYFFSRIDIFSIFSWLPFPHTLGNGLIRLRSICPEGGMLGTLLNPCLVYLFYFNDKYQLIGKYKYVILLAAILTSAGTTVVTFASIFYFKYISKHKYIDFVFALFLVLGGIGFFISMSSSNMIYNKNSRGLGAVIYKIQETANVLTSLDDFESIEGTNVSTFVLTSNFYASNNAPNRLLGTGLGTHRQNYENYVPYSRHPAYGLNKDDGYSLMNRMYSEFGIVGILLFIVFVLKGLDRKDVISFSVLFYIVGVFLRGGLYWQTGNIFFFYLFFLAKKRYNESFLIKKYNENYFCNNCNV